MISCLQLELRLAFLSLFAIKLCGSLIFNLVADSDI
jgi:hypothetical protein